jgi:hypothetical protein
MRVFLLAAGLLLCAASPLLAVTVDLSPAPKPAPKVDAKANCPCDCPKAQSMKHQARVTKRHHYGGAYYHYTAAAAFHPAWHGPYQAPYGAPVIYGPPPSAYEQGLHVDNYGWSGGVGYAPEGGGGGGFVDGYGQVHFPTDAGNGPTYNSYNQSFQFNPSQPGPFQPRLMGGFAPSGR